MEFVVNILIINKLDSETFLHMLKHYMMFQDQFVFA